jgi:hypothetical protein
MDPVTEGITKILTLLSQPKQQVQPQLQQQQQFQQPQHPHPDQENTPESRYNWSHRHRDAYIPKSAPDSSHFKSDALLREHHQWLRNFTARHSDIIRL